MKIMDVDYRVGGLAKILLIAPSLLLLAACSGGGGSGATESANLSISNKAKVGVFMESDSVNPSAKRVIVSVNSVSIKGAGDSTISGIAFNQDVELTSNVVALPNITLSEGQSLQSKEIRLVLNETGNKLIREDGSVCELKTPSGQQSGLKLKLPETFTILPGLRYSVHLSFDVEKSIVEQGNGGCLLKPVIRGQVIAYRPPVDEGGGSGDGGNTDGGNTDGSNTDGGSTSGGDTGGDGSTTGGDTGGDGSTTGGNTDGGGGLDPVIDDVVYQPAPEQVVDIVEVEVSNQ